MKTIKFYTDKAINRIRFYLNKEPLNKIKVYLNETPLNKIKFYIGETSLSRIKFCLNKIPSTICFYVNKYIDVFEIGVVQHIDKAFMRVAAGSHFFLKVFGRTNNSSVVNAFLRQWASFYAHEYTHIKSKYTTRLFAKGNHSDVNRIVTSLYSAFPLKLYDINPHSLADVNDKTLNEIFYKEVF